MFHGMAERDSGRQGKDVNIKLKLTFLEAVHGCTKEVRYEVGSSSQKNRRGKHKMEFKTKTVDVKIPAGVDTVRLMQTRYSSNPSHSFPYFLYIVLLDDSSKCNRHATLFCDAGYDSSDGWAGICRKDRKQCWESCY